MATASKAAVIKTGSLLLDPKNTRIPADRRSEDQRRLLHELLQHEDVRGLAASIAKLGLFPNERLVVMPLDHRHVVLEGNRRLAAIKLLLNPELAPTTALVRYFRGLSAKAGIGELSKLDVAIVANRVAAAPIIAALHTREARKRWSSLQQARFYRELVDEGQTPAEVADDLGVTLGHVQSYLRTEMLYNLALTLKYDTGVRAKLEDSRFPLTTLERFVESKIGRQFLGIELDDKHGFRGLVHPARFKATLARVAADVAMTSGLTRQINDDKGWETYVNKTRPLIPETPMRGSFLPADLLTEGSRTPEPAGRPESPSKRKSPPKQSASIIPRGFACSSVHDRVRAIFAELKGMSATEQRNSTGVMLRVLIDIALWSFLKDTNHSEPARIHFDKDGKKRSHNTDWTPSLRDLISYAVDERLFPGMTADGYKSVRSLASKDAGYVITIDSFNAFTHNPFVTPTESDLRALWQRASPMLEVILAKP